MSLTDLNGRYTCQRCPARGLPRRADQPQMPPAPIDRTKAGPAPVVPVSRARWLWLFRAGGAGRSVEWVGEEEGPGHASLPASCCGCCRAGGAGLTAAPASLALGAAGTGAAAARGPGWAAVGSWWPWLERER